MPQRLSRIYFELKYTGFYNSIEKFYITIFILPFFKMNIFAYFHVFTV